MIEIKRQVAISDKRDLLFHAQLSGFESGDLFKLGLSSEAYSINTEGGDFFDCLLKLREILEEKKLFILCQGSATNVYPSRMARDMSNGLKAYALELGKKSSMDQLVDIFDVASVESVGTIAEQAAFFETWLNSPKR